MNKVLRMGGIAVLALILVGAGLFLVQQQQDQAAAAQTPPPTAVVTRGSIEEAVSATGNVVAERQATLTFKTSGEIAEVLVKAGQQVEAGQVLARLDATSLEWQIARSQAGLDTAQARLEQAQQPPSEEEVDSAQASLDSARANYENVLAGPSEEEIASARASLDSARANYRKVQAGPTAEELASAQAQLDSAVASLQQAQAAYDRIKAQPDAQMRQESLNLQNATISLEQAQANYDALANRPTESDLASAKAQVAQAESQLAALLERPTGSDLASAKAQVAQAESQLAALLERPSAEDVAISQAQVDESIVALAQAQAQLQDAVLAAPFAGTVLTVQINEGEWGSPGAPAIILADTERLILDVNVDEIDVALLAEGQPAYLSFDALKSVGGGQISGRVTHIDATSTNISGAVAYGVEIRIEPTAVAAGLGQDQPLRLGMTADVDIIVASAEDALLVPNRAIAADREAGRYYVTRQKTGGSVERLEVRIGLRDGAHTQILEGLEEGDRLVLPELPDQEPSEGQFSGPPGGGMFGGGGRP